MHQCAKSILVEKGILQDPTKPTVLLDQFTGTQPVAKPERDAKSLVTKVTIDTQTELQGQHLAFDDESSIPLQLNTQALPNVAGDRQPSFGEQR